MNIQLFLYKNLNQCNGSKSEYISRLTLHIEQMLYLTKSKDITLMFDKIEKFLLCLTLNFTLCNNNNNDVDDEILSVLELEIMKKSLQLYKRLLDELEIEKSINEKNFLLFRTDIFILLCNHWLISLKNVELIKCILGIWSKKFPSRHQRLLDLIDDFLSMEFTIFTENNENSQDSKDGNKNKIQRDNPLFNLVIESKNKRLEIEKTMFLVDRIYNDELDDTYSDIENDKMTKSSIKTDPNELILMDMIIKDKSVFQRENRKNPLRKELSIRTGLAHEQIEGWYLMFIRNPTSKNKLASYAASKGILLYSNKDEKENTKEKTEKIKKSMTNKKNSNKIA